MDAVAQLPLPAPSVEIGDAESATTALAQAEISRTSTDLQCEFIRELGSGSNLSATWTN